VCSSDLYLFTTIPWLWYNVIGCGVVVGVAIFLQVVLGKKVTGSSLTAIDSNG
jgi:hypothetical protein